MLYAVRVLQRQGRPLEREVIDKHLREALTKSSRPPKSFRQPMEKAFSTFFNDQEVIKSESKRYRLDDDPGLEDRLLQREDWAIRTLEILDIKVRPHFEVGVGVQLTAFHAWAGARAYRRLNPATALDVHISHADSEQLRMHFLEHHRYDIVITSCGDEFLRTTPGAADSYVRFPIRLLADRRQAMEDVEQTTSAAEEPPGADVAASPPACHHDDGLPAFAPGRRRRLRVEQALQNRRLVVQVERSPSIFPPKHLPESCEILEARSWAEAFATVLASRDTLCIGCPDLLHPRDRTRFQVIDLEGEELGAINVVVLADVKGARKGPWAPPPDQVEKLKSSYLRQLQESVSTTDPEGSVWHQDLRRTAHVTHDANGRLVWIHGRLTNLVLTQDGHLRADHEFDAPNFARHLKLTLKGKITRIKGQRTRFFVACRAWQTGDGDDLYVVTLSGESHDFDKVIAGVWSGRASFLNPHLPGLGFFAVYCGDRKSDDELTRIAHAWHQQYAEASGVRLTDGLKMELPNQKEQHRESTGEEEMSNESSAATA